MTTHHNRAPVERRLDRLREEYDPPVRREESALPPEQFDPLLEKAGDGYAGGTLDPQPGEVRGTAWFLDPPGELSPAARDRGAGWWEEVDPPDEETD